MVLMAGAYGVGFRGLAELLEPVLSHRFEHSVPRASNCLFGHDKRFVHQQGEHVEDLVPL